MSNSISQAETRRILGIVFFITGMALLSASNPAGWGMFVIGLVWIITANNPPQEPANKKAAWIMLGLGVLVFILALAGYLFYKFG